MMERGRPIIRRCKSVLVLGHLQPGGSVACWCLMHGRPCQVTSCQPQAAWVSDVRAHTGLYHSFMSLAPITLKLLPSLELAPPHAQAFCP